MTFNGSLLNVTGDITASGALTAASKSFDIPHPSKPGMRLRYGVLEGPEHGVYLRGITNENIIQLPDYWTNLVHLDSLTVQLTPIGKNLHWIEKIENGKIYITSETGVIDAHYMIIAERKDVEKVKVEYNI